MGDRTHRTVWSHSVASVRRASAVPSDIPPRRLPKRLHTHAERIDHPLGRRQERGDSAIHSRLLVGSVDNYVASLRNLPVWVSSFPLYSNCSVLITSDPLGQSNLLGLPIGRADRDDIPDL